MNMTVDKATRTWEEKPLLFKDIPSGQKTFNYDEMKVQSTMMLNNLRDRLSKSKTY